MAGGSGLAGLAVTGLLSALVAFGVASLLAPSPQPPPKESPASIAASDLRREVESLRREVEELRSGRAARSAAPAPAGGPAPDAAAATGTASPAAPPSDADGPLPASRRELVDLIDRRLAAKGAAFANAPPRKRVSIEEAGAEMGLSAVDVDSVRRIWRDSEHELIAMVMGTTDMESIKEELRGAKEDPDRKASLINKAAGNAIRNLGRLATLEDRRERDLRRFLTKEQIEKLKGYDIKSAMDDPELEEILEDVLD